MKKDIEVETVKDVYLVIVPEYNALFKSNDWNVFLVNDKDITIEMILIVSKGFDNDRETAQMRHKVETLPKKSAVKIEFMVEEVLSLNNEFKITFFANNKLFDKNFMVKKNSLKEGNLRMVKALNKRGVVIR